MADASLRIILKDETTPGTQSQTPPLPQGHGQAAQQSPGSSPGGQQVNGAPAGRTGGPRKSGGSEAAAVAKTVGQVASAAGFGEAVSSAGTVAAIGGALAELGPVGIALVALAGGAIAAAGALKLFSMMIANQAKELEAYSTSVSMAVSQNEIRQELMMFRRADRIGGDIARFEDLRGRANDAMSDIWTEILRLMLDLAETVKPGLEEGVLILRVIPPAIEMLSATFREWFDWWNNNAAGMAKDEADFNAAVLKLLKRLVELGDGMKDDPPGDDPWIGEFFAIMDERRKWDERRRPAPAPAPGAHP